MNVNHKWDRASLMMENTNDVLSGVVQNTNDVLTGVVQNTNDALVGAVQTTGNKLKTLTGITKSIQDSKTASTA